MADISRATSFGKLNPILYKAIEGATVFAKLRGNPYVELVHWINQLLQLQDSDLHRILRHFNVPGRDSFRSSAPYLAAGYQGGTTMDFVQTYLDAIRYPCYPVGDARRVQSCPQVGDEHR